MKEYIAEYIIPVEKKGNDNMFDFMNATPLIRCKDCKHYDKFIRQNIGQGWCDIAAWRGRYMGNEDFCSRAERREHAKRKS